MALNGNTHKNTIDTRFRAFATGMRKGEIIHRNGVSISPGESINLRQLPDSINLHGEFTGEDEMIALMFRRAWN